MQAMSNLGDTVGGVTFTPPIDFVEFLCGELVMTRESAEHFLRSELLKNYVAPRTVAAPHSGPGVTKSLEAPEDRTVRAPLRTAVG